MSALESSTSRRPLHGLRQVKTAYEQKILIESVDISSEAHIAGMRAARPERFEREVESAIEERLSRARRDVAGISVHRRQRSERDDAALLRLVAADERGRSAARRRGRQLTRGRPATSRAPIRSSGRFTPQQREIYELVLAAQDAGMKAARIGARRSTSSAPPKRSSRQGLLKLDLITDASGPAIPDVVHARHLPLDRHGRPRRRRLPAAARSRNGVCHRAGALHPSGGARAAAGHAGEPRLPREGRGRPSRSTQGSASASRTRSC